MVAVRAIRLDDGEIDALITAVAAGDERAWRALWAELEPRLLGLVRTPRVSGRLSKSDDDVRNIVVEVMGRLRADGFRRVRAFLDARAASPSLSFVPWLVVVAKRVVIDYMRGHDEYIDRRHRPERDGATGAWVVPAPLPSDSQLGERPPVTQNGTAMQMLRHACARFPADQQRALLLWIDDAGFDEIAAVLGLADEAEARRAVRAALERLRRHFRPSNEAGDPPAAAARAGEE